MEVLKSSNITFVLLHLSFSTLTFRHRRSFMEVFMVIDFPDRRIRNAGSQILKRFFCNSSPSVFPTNLSIQFIFHISIFYRWSSRSWDAECRTVTFPTVFSRCCTFLFPPSTFLCAKVFSIADLLADLFSAIQYWSFVKLISYPVLCFYNGFPAILFWHRRSTIG